MAKGVSIFGPKKRGSSKGQRVRSIRGCREKAGQYRLAMERGEISPSDYARLLTGIKIEAELFMAENTLTTFGGDTENMDHPVDEFGGESGTRVAMKPHRVKRVTVKQGVDRHGNAVNEKTVALESSEADADAEILAEIEAIM